MKFEEIFKEEGLYKADSFAIGVAFKIDNQKKLSIVTYRDKNDLLPEEEQPIIYEYLFQKQYTKVLNKQSLFS